MARRARLVIPGLPHYIQQSGWNDRPVFLSREDGKFYRDVLRKRCAASGLLILSYCFLPTEIHLLAVPLKKDSLRKGIGDTHRQYARHMNANHDINGQLWADRFHSFPLQEKYTHHVLHLIEWTPVLSGEVKMPHQWHYSSARTRRNEEFDDLVTDHPLLEYVDWQKVDIKKPSYLQMDLIYSHQSTGRPLGDQQFVSDLEQKLGKRLRPRKRGRRPKAPPLSGILKDAANS